MFNIHSVIIVPLITEPAAVPDMTIIQGVYLDQAVLTITHDIGNWEYFIITNNQK